MSTATFPKTDPTASWNDDLPDLVRESHPLANEFVAFGESGSTSFGRSDEQPSGNQTALFSRRTFRERTRVIPVCGSTITPQKQFQPLQQWEGVVTSIDVDSIGVELKDLTTPNHPVEFAELPMGDIPNEDRRLLELGSVLYWSIGYKRSPGGTIERVSVVRMRRAPRWSRREVDTISAKAATLFTQIMRHDAIVSTAD